MCQHFLASVCTGCICAMGTSAVTGTIWSGFSMRYLIIIIIQRNSVISNHTHQTAKIENAAFYHTLCDMYQYTLRPGVLL
jgi:hypothetical protein